jgi:hypothetical protein
MERQVTAIKKALMLFDTCHEEISNQQAATEDKIHSTFRSLRRILDAREAKLVSQLDQKSQGKLKSLAVQRNQIETALAQRNSCLHFMRESLRADGEEDVLIKASAIKQVKELIIPFKSEFLKPKTKSDITFSASMDMTALCQNYGEVLPQDTPKCGKGMKLPAKGSIRREMIEKQRVWSEHDEEDAFGRSRSGLAFEKRGSTAGLVGRRWMRRGHVHTCRRKTIEGSTEYCYHSGGQQGQHMFESDEDSL